VDVDYLERHSLPVVTLMLITGLQVLSQASHSPAWLSAFVILICIYRFLSERNFARHTPFLLRMFLVCVSTVVFFLYYRTNFSVDMAASFLLLASTLKLLEIRNAKDTKIFIYTMFYLSGVSFLFEQSFSHTVLQLVLILCCLYGLVCLHSGYFSGSKLVFLKYQSGSLLKVALVSIPLVAFLFIFFPRIGPLWSNPIAVQTATTGISDTMSPGGIAEVAKSSARAFRVSFSKGLPKQQDLYWRGLILDEFDGKTWRQSGSQFLKREHTKIDSGTFYSHGDDFYKVMLEPHQQQWLFVLEGSRASSSNVIKSDMGLFRLKTDAIQATHYKMTFQSDLKSNLDVLPILNPLSEAYRPYYLHNEHKTLALYQT